MHSGPAATESVAAGPEYVYAQVTRSSSLQSAASDVLDPD